MSIRVDISEFLASWRRISNEIPLAVIEGFGKTAERGRDTMRRRVKRVFKLHSAYIPRGILSIPDRHRGEKIFKRQSNAALKGLLGKYGNFQAAVFVRGATDPKRSLDFLALHEKGGVKKSMDGPGDIALPREGLKRKKFRTPRGAVRKLNKPHYILNLPKTSRKNRGFILESKSGKKFIAQIINKKFGFMYRLLPQTKIDPRLSFERTVKRVVKHYIEKDITAYVNRVK